MRTVKKGLVPFWDESLIDRQYSDVTLSANQAEKEEVVMVCDLPWEGNSSNYYSIINDDGLYRMYYNGWSFLDPTYKEGMSVCYAESRDGIHWNKPDLGLCEFRGSTHNNIIMRRIPDNFTAMKDENPAEPPERRYKALLQYSDVTGFKSTFPETEGKSLVCMTSADGIRFEKYCVVSRGYTYDSMNTLHWNPHTNRYYCYFRRLHKRPEDPTSNLNETDVREIAVIESEDLLHWSEPKPLSFEGGEDYPLYTNCISAYPFDTRYYVGFPTRYVERKSWTPNFDRLSGADARRERMRGNPRYGLAITDCVFMSSCDNLHFHRFDEACITPGPETGLNWVYGDCYPAVGGVIETPARLAGDPPVLSLYMTRNRWMNKNMELVRYSFRRDGFASVKADYKGKTLRTIPFTFEGDSLALNFRTSARGGMVLSILDEGGEPIPGYTTCELFGDSTERPIDFDAPLSALQGKVVRFSFFMRDAELFALRFS